MRFAVAASILGVALLGAVLWLQAPQRATSGAAFALVERYCTDCHNAGELAGDLRLEDRDPARLADEAEIWEAVISKLDAGLMPPPGEPRPPAAELAGLADWLADELDAHARAHPNPGAPVLHRLNRAEYANAIRDLLALPVDASTLLPADDASEGFDNIANALVVSPAHMQAYVAAAAKISRLAVGDPTVSPAMTSYSAPGGQDQALHVEGLPLGTRGGLSVTHVFPLDAEYEITARRFGGGIFLDTVGGDEDLEVTLDGARLALLPAGSPSRLRAPISAGPHELTAALVASSRPAGVDDLYAVHARSAGVTGLSIMGPFAPSGPGDTPSRRRVFVCTPAEVPEPECVRTILRQLASRAFRRPVETADPSLETLLEFYDEGAATRGFEGGIQYALARILVDPQFIFRFEEEPAGLDDGAVYPVGSLELASRLSFFLWSSIPDDELLAVASRGELENPGVLEAQVIRMLADDRATALVDNFASQWLMLRQLDSVSPAGSRFDDNLRRSLKRETELLFESILHEDRSIVDLLDADYTFVDERLAAHYGIPQVRGSHFRRVSLGEDSPRRGVLGHGSILTVTSAPNRTSPVVRGAWILANILGTPAPLPPPGVERNLDAVPGAATLPVSLRARLEQHRADPSCAACHRLIDPLGFALENFDEIGQWRERDGGGPIDARGELWDGTALGGPADLRAALLARRDAFVEVAAKKLMTYALGRSVEAYDMPAVREIVRRAAVDEYRFSALVLGIVESVPFRYKIKTPAGKPTAREGR